MTEILQHNDCVCALRNARDAIKSGLALVRGLACVFLGTRNGGYLIFLNGCAHATGGSWELGGGGRGRKDKETAQGNL
jgi:hypothetical protein